MRSFLLLSAVALSLTCGPTQGQGPLGYGGTVGPSSKGTGGQTSHGGTTGTPQSDTGGAVSTGGRVGSGGAPGAGGTLDSGGAGGSKSGAGGYTGGKGNCHDGTKNQDETDADCGGGICAPRCAIGKGCLVDGDCVTATPALQCLETTKKCVDPCSNQKKDGDETDVDCGGTCPLKCLGDPCKDDATCKSDSCDPTKAVCIPTTHPLANIDQACWDGLASTFNPNAVTIATSKLIPCMLANRCCKKLAKSCTDPCYTNIDAVCGVNKTGGDNAPYTLVTSYYQKCVVP